MLAKTNSDRQRDWRLRHREEPRGNRAAKLEIAALRARVAELEAMLAGCNWPGAPGHFRLAPELNELADLTRDETVVDHLLGYLVKQPIFLSESDDHFLPHLIDVMKRAPAAFLNACERAWADVEAQLTSRRTGIPPRLNLDGHIKQGEAGLIVDKRDRPRVGSRYRRHSLRNRHEGVHEF
jgi:hypothetical protein